MASDFNTVDLDDFQRTQFKLLGDRPTRDIANSKTGFDRGFDGFGGIEVHHVLKLLQRDAGFFQSTLDNAARAGALFAHEKV